jgi:dermatan 4-sulfotransferase 1
MRYIAGYTELLLRYGSLSRHPLFAEMRPELRHPAFRRVSMSRKLGFCYFRVPKAANTTITQTLQVNMGAITSDTPPILPKHTLPKHALPKHSLHQVPNPNEMADLFVFTVVRSPVTRLLSTYLHKVAQEKYRKRFGFYHSDNRKSFSFEDFLQRLLDDLLFSDIHWAPQTSILPYDIGKYDYIGKFEKLDEDLKLITSKIFSKPSPIYTIDGHKTASMELLLQVSRRELGIVRKLYDQDFVEFGYDI